MVDGSSSQPVDLAPADTGHGADAMAAAADLASQLEPESGEHEVTHGAIRPPTAGAQRPVSGHANASGHGQEVTRLIASPLHFDRSSAETVVGARPISTAALRADPSSAETVVGVRPPIPAANLSEAAALPKPQDEARATLAPKITKQEALLDWREPALALERRVRAFDPWPVAEARLSDGRRLRVFEAEVVADAPEAPAGTIVAARRAGIDVATGDGVLRLRRIQPPSGRVMDAESYLAAHSVSGVEFVG